MSEHPATIVVRYSLFASGSTVLNIAAQMLSVALYTGAFYIEISILVGTAVGLPLRYLLEKRYIFNFATRSIGHDGRLFISYSLIGVFTTVIFWGIEYIFHLLFAPDVMRYVGGIVGLAIGFYVKYRLDKRFVFVSGNRQALV